MRKVQKDVGTRSYLAIRAFRVPDPQRWGFDLDEIPGRHLSNGKFTGQWTRTELEKYALAMGKFGDDWQRIAEEVGTREMRQCRDRYHYVER